MTPDELKSLRAAAGLTQRDVAERLGVNRLTVARWEQGGRAISVPMAKLIRLTCRPARTKPAK